eukprot:TRINITY_DN760_c0_g3_i1.p1 TRINITY_DN760_c0_g3~~TRINITY_DN760_c0_g3_i1.p1  ORF type:complete len:1216 (+),score=83.34 TRINITY_DN760_c0_g3_i1:1502-5149(+)
MIYTGKKAPDLFYLDKLLLCGDIHPNPGPMNDNEYVKCNEKIFDNFKVISVNIRSINTSLGHLEILCHDYDPDALLIQESYLTPEKETPQLEGYTVYRKDRTVAKQNNKKVSGGGLLTYIKKCHSFKIVNVVQCYGDPFEVSAVELDLDERLVLYNIYRPPITTKNDDRNRLLDLGCFDLKNYSNCNVIICGDINAHSPLWDSNINECEYGEQISEWINENNLVCWNEPNIPTRLQSNSSPDIIITNSNTNIESWSTLGTVNSDHSPMMVILQGKCRNINYKKYFKGGFNWSKANWVKYQEYLEVASERISRVKINTKKAKMFKNEILKAKNLFIPRIFVRRVKSNCWWNSSLIEKLRKFEEKQKEILDDNDLSDANLKLLNDLNEQICNSVKECKEMQQAKMVKGCVNERGDMSESGILHFMNDVRKIDGRFTKTETPFLHDENMNKISDDEEKANVFTDFFSTVVCKDASYKYREGFDKNIKQDVIPFTEEEVLSQLSKLHGTKASPDGVNAILLQNLGRKMLCLLVEILNNSWVNMVVPSDWKQTYWVPLLKKGKDPHNPASYRMIALTPAITKLIEKIIKNRLVFLLEKKNNEISGLSCHQAAYRKTRSCREQIIYLIDLLKENKIKGKISAVVFMDIKKAFDSVSHAKLFDRMRKAKIPENYIRWTESFLHKRTAATIVNGKVGKYIKISNGVPQGTVLASLLFVLYIDEVSEIISRQANLSLYADDVAFVLSDTKLEPLAEKVQKVFSETERFMTDKDLELSKEKTKVMLIASERNPIKIMNIKVLFEDGTPLKESVEERFLGLCIDNNLSFNGHADQICKSVTKRLRFLKMLGDKRWGCTKRILRLIYIIYILPIFTYAIESVYTFIVSNRRIWSKFEVLHMKAARIITGADFGTRNENVFSESCLAEIRDYFLLEVARWTAKIERLRGSPCMSRLMEKRSAGQSNLSVLCPAALTYGDIGLTGLPVEKYPPVSFPPWKVFNNVIIDDEIGVKKSKSKEENLEICNEKINTLRKKYAGDLLTTIFTDGSVCDGRGGSSFTLELNEVVFDAKFPAGRLCTSFRAELFALFHSLEAILKYIKTNAYNENTILIITDSKSALTELKRGAVNQKTELGLKCWILIDILGGLGMRIHMIHIFSHCGLEGNERADMLAIEAVDEDQSHVKIDYKTATTKMRSQLTKVSVKKKKKKKNEKQRKRCLDCGKLKIVR